jgi:hypothetical protein
MRQSYTTDAYFQRLDALFVDGGFTYAFHQLPYWQTHRWAWWKRMAANYVRFLVLSTRILQQVDDPALRNRYAVQLRRVLRSRAFEPHILFIYSAKVALHYHYASIVQSAGEVAVGNRAPVPAGLRSFSRAKTDAQHTAATA